MFLKNSTTATITLRGIKMPPNAVAEFNDCLANDAHFAAFVAQNRLRSVSGPATVNATGPIKKGRGK